MSDPGVRMERKKVQAVREAERSLREASLISPGKMEEHQRKLAEAIKSLTDERDRQKKRGEGMDIEREILEKFKYLQERTAQGQVKGGLYISTFLALLETVLRRHMEPVYIEDVIRQAGRLALDVQAEVLGESDYYKIYPHGKSSLLPREGVLDKVAMIRFYLEGYDGYEATGFDGG